MAHEKIGETIEELERIAEMLRRRIELTKTTYETYVREVELVEAKIERLKKEGGCQGKA